MHQLYSRRLSIRPFVRPSLRRILTFNARSHCHIVSGSRGAKLVWRSGNSVRHINEVTLRRARLVLGWVMTFGGYTIPVFIQATQAHLAWPLLRG